MDKGWNIALTIVSCTLIAAIFLPYNKRRNPFRTIGRKVSRFLKPIETFIEQHHVLFFWMIFLLCASVRIVFFPSVPGGLNQDEASMGYDAYATAFFGIDRNGHHLPIYAMSWGSGQNVLMMYFTVFFVRILGLSVFSVRLTALVFGIIAPVVLYHLVRLLTEDKSKRVSRIPALFAFFLLSVSPWHIMLSRWALESNILPAVFLIGVYLLVLAVQKKKTLYFCLSAGVFALSMYAYATVCLIMPIFLLGVVVFLMMKKLISVKQVVYSVIVFLVLATPMILFFAVNVFGLEPIYTSFLSIPKLSALRSGISPGSALENASVFMDILMTQNDNLLWNSIDGFGIVYLFLLPFALVGVASVISERSRSPNKLVMAWWLLCAFVLSCLIYTNINRMNLFFIPYIYMICEGVMFVSRRARLTTAVITVLTAATFIAFCGVYFGNEYRNDIEQCFYASYGEAVEVADKVSEGREVYLEIINGTEVMALFYTKFDPREYVETVVYETHNAEFRFVSSFGKYHIGIPEEKESSAVYVVSNDRLGEFDDDVFEIKQFEYYSVAIGRGD